MGFVSEGKGLGSTFYFELPLYSHGVDEVQEREVVETVKQSSKSSFLSHITRDSGSVATFNSTYNSFNLSEGHKFFDAAAALFDYSGYFLFLLGT